MCGRYAVTLPPEAMRRIFGFVEQPNFPPRFNVAPTQPVPIVRRGADGLRHFALVRWGLVPAWAREVGQKPLINARAETIADKPSFRSAFRRRRCLVPADGFYEWQTRATGRKQPFFIRRRDGRPMAFAGIWEHWQTPEGSELESCAIVTTDANAALRPIHARMPAILEEAAWEVWLDPDERRAPDALATLAPAPDTLLEAIPVSTRVNAVANDDAGLVAPIGEPGRRGGGPPLSDGQGRLV